jgi:excisionase family DNA binding protein
MEGMQTATITVPEAARRLGIGRNSAYEAARRGEIPVIRLGKRMVVPLAAFDAMLAVQSKQQIVATELVRRLQDEPV